MSRRRGISLESSHSTSHSLPSPRTGPTASDNCHSFIFSPPKKLYLLHMGGHMLDFAILGAPGRTLAHLF